ncbi:MAG: muconate cycloisomerase family protein [Burkholderiaceae bacterium]
MKIHSVETILVDIPTKRVHQLSFGEVTTQNYVIVRIRDSDGRIGLGEASTIGGPAWAEESTETIKTIIDRYLTPRLIGRDPQSMVALSASMNLWVKGNRFAKAAVEMALLDLVARAMTIPAVQLLGGQVHQRLELAWTLASGCTQQDIEEGEAKLAGNLHRTFKLKIGYGEPSVDVAHVCAIANHFGERARIQVDVNQAWDELTATRCIAALQDAGVCLIEQPVPRHQAGAMARIARRFDVPIMADESAATPEDALNLIRWEAADVLALKLTKAGGPWATLQTAAIAQAAGVPCYGGCMLETSVGTAAYLHTFAAIAGISWGCELFGPLLLVDDLITEPLDYHDFSIHLHDGIGFGIELDPEKLGFYRRDRDTVVPVSVLP